MATLRRWSVAISLFIAMILDGVIAYNFQGLFYQGNFKAACWFSVVGITLIALMDDRNANNIWLALGIGILADSFYLGFFGVYTVVLPLVCFGVQKLARFLPEVFWARLVFCLLVYLLVEIYVFLIFSIVGVEQVGINALLKDIPFSLLVCAIIFLITYAFWGWIENKYPFLESQRNYY